jgi:hypothetical protein
MTKQPAISPNDLPTKTVRAADGSTLTVKVVESESPTLAQDLLAAFRWNVRQVRAEQQERGSGRHAAGA